MSRTACSRAFRLGIPLLLALFVLVPALPAAAPHLFAREFRVSEIMNDPVRASQFVRKVLEREAEFFAVARNPQTGLTYDGVELDQQTGGPIKTRDWSAPSKECLDLGILIRVIAGDPLAALVVSPGEPDQARNLAASILARKLASYRRFNAKHPGYGGFLPWFLSRSELAPTDDWIGQIPGLDNGEWIWTMFLAERVLRRTGRTGLADEYARYNELLRSRVVPVFYDPAARKVRADVRVVSPDSADSRYETMNQPGRQAYLSGPDGVHEGMMLVLFVTLFGRELPAGASDAIWSTIQMKRIEHAYGTTWQGCWGSAHESWAYLFLPLREIPRFSQLFRIREIIRSQNAAARKYPGLASSANQPGPPGYLDAAGIEGVGILPCRNNHTFAAYGSFPMLLDLPGHPRQTANTAGLSWLLNMLWADRMQGPLGMGEAATNDGTKVSYVKTIDGSFPVVLAILGGVGPECAEMLAHHGLFDAFKRILLGKYQEAFGDTPLREPVGYMVPTATVPQGILGDYAVDERKR